MTKEQFAALPDEKRHEYGANYARFQELGRLSRALAHLRYYQHPEFASFFPDRKLVEQLQADLRTYIRDHSKTFDICEQCLPLVRKSKARKNTRYGIESTCAICNYTSRRHPSNTPTTNRSIYRIRHTSSAAETRLWFQHNYPELSL